MKKALIALSLLLTLMVPEAYARDVAEMIRRWIDLIKIPARLVLGAAFAFTGFKWFQSGDEGRKATTAALIGILVFFIGFEIVVNWLSP
jgi:Zn-dependent protease with chaperone function